MPSRAEIVSFDDSPPPPGANPWVVADAGPGAGIEVTDPDPAWPRQYDRDVRLSAMMASALPPAKTTPAARLTLASR
jgi:hypothetical protein